MFSDSISQIVHMQRIFRFSTKTMASSNGVIVTKTLPSGPSGCKQIHDSVPTEGLFYKEAITALNGLQSNPQTLEKSRRDKTLAAQHVPQMCTFLAKLGIMLGDLSCLNAIHVAGTKGKGSTCAFTDSILRCHGLRTGFYSSPHILEARERIRICGQPLSQQSFATYFWEVYTCLRRGCDSMPPYFMFLTIMAFYTFLREKVDVAVIEVGLGGEYDCTNVLRKPVVVGITPIGLDHTTILGDTLPKIAWQKSGIFKNGVPAFTVPQADGVMPVFKERAQQIGCTLQLVPPLEMYRCEKLTLGIPGPVQRINASLAIHLANAWLGSIHPGAKRLSRLSTECTFIASKFFLPPPIAEPFELTHAFLEGLKKCFWPGRFQIVRKGRVTYFLDGAHTEESMTFCCKWFLEASRLESCRRALRIVLFNCTGDRRAETLLSPLAELSLDMVLFSPNHIFPIKDSASDQSNFSVDAEKEWKQCQTNERIWSYLQSIVAEDGRPSPECRIFPCLSQALELVSTLQSADRPVHVLATGSLHLVGGVLAVVDPSAVDVPHS